MPGAELEAGVRDGHSVVVLRGDLDVTGAADAGVAIAAMMTRGQTLVIDMSALDFMDCASLGVLLKVQTLARRGGGDVVLAAPQPYVRRPQDAVSLAAACGAHCTPWDGSAIVYWYRLIAAGAAAAPADPWRGRMRR